MTNRELQDLLKQYPDDMQIGCVTYDPDWPFDYEVENATGIKVMSLGVNERESTHKRIVIC